MSSYIHIYMHMYIYDCICTYIYNFFDSCTRESVSNISMWHLYLIFMYIHAWNLEFRKLTMSWSWVDFKFRLCVNFPGPNPLVYHKCLRLFCLLVTRSGDITFWSLLYTLLLFLNYTYMHMCTNIHTYVCISGFSFLIFLK